MVLQKLHGKSTDMRINSKELAIL